MTVSDARIPAVETSVWKYELNQYAETSPIEMPDGAAIVHAAVDGEGQPCVWAHVDPEAPLVVRHLGMFGTGWDVPVGARHHGTFVKWPFVWHVMEVSP